MDGNGSFPGEITTVWPDFRLQVLLGAVACRMVGEPRQLFFENRSCSPKDVGMGQNL